MNSTLQCLIHINDLVSYFLNEFPKDCNLLKEKNKNATTKGNISKAFYELIKEIFKKPNETDNSLNFSTTPELYDVNNFNNYEFLTNYISPDNFHKTLGHYNPQFKYFEANDSKDLILYLFQSIHSELNYLGDNPMNNQMPPNQYNRINAFNYFVNSYDLHNFSIISRIFYGTSENMTTCKKCKNILYNFQKFEFLSFGMFKYNGKDFNLYDGFDDNEKVQLLTGDNKFYCLNCKQSQEAEIITKILVPPNKLLINLDYGKNKKYNPRSVKFDEEINITRYVSFQYGFDIKYKLIGISTHFGDSGMYGHYVAFCKNSNNDKWYMFNDASVNECKKNDIYVGTPYLLLYERIIKN